MASEAEDSSGRTIDDEINSSDMDSLITELRKDYENLSNKAQTILSEKLLLESEFAQLKKEQKDLTMNYVISKHHHWLLDIFKT